MKINSRRFKTKIKNMFFSFIETTLVIAFFILLMCMESIVDNICNMIW